MASPEILSEAGPSTIPKAQCAVCTSRSAIYACPRCTTRTCSLPCSTAHKARTGCTGVRDKAKFVPMNSYTLGTMMDDYVYLEETGRKVEEWGKDIARGGYAAGKEHGWSRGGRGQARGRGRGGTQRTKRDVLKMMLESRDVDVDMLPTGMERRALNQSTWDSKKQVAFLTIEFKFHPPPDPKADPTDPQDPPYTLLTHRNCSDESLLSLMQYHVKTKTKRDNQAPPWLRALALPNSDVPDIFSVPHFFMPTKLDTIAAGGTTVYHRLDPSQKLLDLLRQKFFVEFPTIEVWEEGAFRGIVVDAHGATKDEGVERPAKRRKVDVRKARKTMKGLIGNYGSEDDEAKDPLSVLGVYEGSDEEIQPTPGDVVFDEAEGGTDDAEGSDDDVGPVDYAALLDIMRQAKERQSGNPEDEVDWGDSDEEENIHA
ncbi:hypothetical protein BV25DRAFT_1817717 [Artomyces pyxidatus]|uniref:Uncharacterized protein n=1 Tax=Artomyces pyxidatus TaxID=48021 RepID=A0ACB8TK75_9AGAM|nr:hypothetical protein BV25DRAFT_1817717 [Artomyces pyxidatus]